MTQPIYKNPQQPTENRVSDLLSRMTLAEKIAQLGSCWVFELLDNLTFSPEKAAPIMSHGLGQITRVAGASSLDPNDGAKVANAIQKYLVENTRLGIPVLVHEECCSGYMARKATCFPQIIGLASTWQPELTEAMADVVRLQMRAGGAQQGLSPVIDITRDPRWGRVEETFGEDTYLVSTMGVSFVKGLQGKNWSEGVIATAKHLVAYGLPEGGMNWAPVHLPKRELHEMFLTPFEAAVKEANLMSVMNAYHELDGVPCAISKELLTDILRNEWGFKGIVVSDYFAIKQVQDTHKITDNRQDAAILALDAGIDVELPSTDCYGSPLHEAVTKGLISESLIDRSVSRVLEMKFMVGLFENPYVNEATAQDVFDTPVQRQLALDIARKSIVLLKNEGQTLPLKKNIGSIAVIGPNAHTVRHLIGDYTYPSHIETLQEMLEGDHNVFNMPIPDNMALEDNFVAIKSLFEGLQAKVSPETVLRYVQGCEVNSQDTSGFAEAIALAKQSEIAIVMVGEKSGLTDSATCGEARDRSDLELPGVQQALIQAIYETGTPVIAVLVNGRPLSVTWMEEHLSAILEVWLPGEEGAAAVAEVLFGEYNPGGKLPITFPRAVGQIPIYYNHKPSGGRSHWKGEYVALSNKPLYPFGYGLSYTTFQFSNLRLSQTEVNIGDAVEISLDVTNTGHYAGDEVVQLYLRDVLAGVTRPVKELKGFKRITLEPQETQTITFKLFTQQLGFYNQAMQFVVEPGTIQLMLGSSSEDIQLQADIELIGAVTDISQTKRFFSEVTLN